MENNVEKRYITATMLFGEAVRTTIEDVLDCSWASGPTLGWKASEVVHHNLLKRDKRYDALSEKKQNHARGLLVAGVDDVKRIITPYMNAGDRDRSYEIGQHADTVTTIALLALNNERRLGEIIAMNNRHHNSYDARIRGRGVMVEPSYFPDSEKGCPFAGAKVIGELDIDPARPIFNRFCRWAIDLTLADLDRRGHFDQTL